MKKSIILLLSVSILIMGHSYAQNSMATLPTFDSLFISPKTVAEAGQAFDLIKNAPIFLSSKREKANNCENRAEFTYFVLEKMGFKPINFWIFKEGLVEPKYSTAREVRRSNGLAFNTSTSGRDMVFWGYHVAAGLIVQNGMHPDTLVFDPWTQGKLTTLKQWSTSFFQEPAGRTVYIFPVTGQYRFYGTTTIGQVSNMKEDWIKNLDTDFNQMYCGLCGITPNEKCSKARFRNTILAKKEEISAYLRSKKISLE
ncbi:protein-glutamine glutaminase family protein [Pedobacter sp. UBA5917]|jgi:hypothetical protein|uniref:protein-glutamine glutaminase family protein n=1 Tax=Pedobacter sp. UBA5917 TaxID=1947061 RepID=UPI0025F44EB9|nr:protein-glutamine glutaminase family protein [Pedobacter sp. UBA5917]